MKTKLTLQIILFLSFSVCYSQTISWLENTSPVTTQLTSVSAIDNSFVWICGYSGVVLRTSNGGQNWTNVSASPIPPALNLHCIYGIDSNTAIVCGSDVNGYLFKTTNRGQNWTQVFTQTGGFFDAVIFGNAAAGFLIGDPVGGRWSLWGTYNGGLTWDSTNFYVPQAGTEAGWNNSMFFDLIGGNVFFGTNNTRVYKTANLLNWTAQTTTSQVNSYAIWFNSASMGMTGGTALLMTTNGGTNWTPVTGALPGIANISGITGVNNAWFVTRQATIIYNSSNNGTTWATNYTAPAGNYRHITKARNFGGTYNFWAVRTNGGISKGVEFMGIKTISNGIPENFSLSQNYPNPFNPETVIRYSIIANGFVSLKIYDELGREIQTLVNEAQKPGIYETGWDASKFSSGVYYYKLISGEFSQTKKMLLVK